MIMFIGIYVMYYMATVAGNTKGSDFFYYHVLPGDVQLHNPKIIYIWTTYFRDYQQWKWGIGPTPIISDCNDAEIDKNQHRSFVLELRRIKYWLSVLITDA